MSARAHVVPTHPRRRGRRAASVAALFALALGVLFLAAPASAAPQTETIDFGAGTSAPAGATLANQVGWSVDIGSGADTSWALTNGSVTTFSFDRPVDLRFGISGLNATNEDVKLPAGTVVEELDPSHTWDPDNFVVAGPGVSCQDCVSTFTLEDTTSLTGEPLSNFTWVRGIAFVEVTYNLPVVDVVGPEDGGTYTEGDGTVLDFTCADGTGEVFGGAIISGETVEDGEAPIDNGDRIDLFGPGTYTIEVACVDENGAIDLQRITFVVEPAPEPACTEDGFQVFEPPHIDLHPPSNGVSDGVHNHTEPVVEDVVDPLVTSLGLPELQPVVHDLNCEVIVPVEDAVDEILIPVVTEVKKLLGGLFG